MSARGAMVRLLALIALCPPLLGFGCYTIESVQDAQLPYTPGADPSLLLASNGKFYAYTTTLGLVAVPVYSSPSMAPGTWSFEGNALGSLANWSDGGPLWAPEVVRKGSTYYLYYTAYITHPLWEPTSGEHAIGVACSGSPAGPFYDCSASYLDIDIPVVRDPGKNGVIDAEVVQHGSDYYLLWSLDWGPGGFGSSVTRKIQGCRLKSDMKLCDGATVDILSASEPWEQGVVENPSMIMGEEGHYILFYSGGFYKNAYRTGAAWCGATHPLVACVKNPNPVLGDGTFPGVNNPGGLDVIPWLYGRALGVFHAANDYSSGDPRRMYTASLDYVVAQ